MEARLEYRINDAGDLPAIMRDILARFLRIPA